MAPDKFTPGSDPTADFIRSLQDPTKFRVKRNVPIFSPHVRQRRDGDGKVTGQYEVTEDDLPVIAEKAQKKQKERRTVGRITVGHIRLDPEFPEKDQPEIIGYQANLRVGRLEKTPVVVADHYVKVDHWDEYESFPFRSVDYRHKGREIMGVACLRRDPELDLGLVGYQRDPEETCSQGTVAFYPEAREEDEVLLYQKDVHMADQVPMPPEKKDPAPGPQNTPPPDGAAGGEDEHYQKFCGHYQRYSKEHPELSFIHDQVKKHPDYEQYAAGMGGANQGGMPGPTNTSAPALVGDKPEKKKGPPMPPEQMQRTDPDVEQLQAQLAEAQGAATEAQRELDETRNMLIAERRAAAEEAVQYMRDEGYAVDDEDVQELAGLAPDKRQAKVQRWRGKMQRAKGPAVEERKGAPVQYKAGPLFTSRSTSPAAKRDMTTEVRDKIVEYAGKHGIKDFDEAKQKYLSQN